MADQIPAQSASQFPDIGCVVEVVTLPGYDELPDMRGFLGEVVGVATYGQIGSVISVEFGPHSPAPDGFDFLPEHLRVVDRWPDAV